MTTSSINLRPPDVAATRSSPRIGLPDAWPDEMPGGGLRRSVFLPAEPASARVARRLTAGVLADWQVSEIGYDVCLCVSELVGNACPQTEESGPEDSVSGHPGPGNPGPENPGRAGWAHERAPGLVRVTLQLSGSCLQVEVRDGDPRGPAQRSLPSLDGLDPGSAPRGTPDPGTADMPGADMLGTGTMGTGTMSAPLLERRLLGASLRVVQALSDGWTWQRVTKGKVVACWFTIRNSSRAGRNL